MARVHHESSKAAYNGVSPPMPGGRARREAAWREVFSMPGCSPYVAEVNGEIVGVLNVGPAREEPGTGELYVIYVHPAWWGSPAGQLLIERAQEDLGDRYPEAVLTVLAANARARRFYERNGWHLEAVETELHFDGHPTEVAAYRKVLR